MSHHGQPRYPHIEVPGSPVGGDKLVGDVHLALILAKVPVQEAEKFLDEALAGDDEHARRTCIAWVTVSEPKLEPSRHLYTDEAIDRLPTPEWLAQAMPSTKKRHPVEAVWVGLVQLFLVALVVLVFVVVVYLLAGSA